MFYSRTIPRHRARGSQHMLAEFFILNIKTAETHMSSGLPKSFNTKYFLNLIKPVVTKYFSCTNLAQRVR